MTTTAAKFRIDVMINDLLTTATRRPPAPAESRGLTLPTPVFPQHPERLNDPGTDVPPGKRKWALNDIYRTSRGWLFPYVRSRVMPGEFHPITAYLFLEYKCNLDCWYCWSFDNKVKGMTEDVARRSIDWLHDHGCRVLALMGGEPLLRPDFVAKDRHVSAITPANYRLELIGEDSVGPYRCYLPRATPKRVDRYLFEGKVWVDENDFAVVRCSAHLPNEPLWLRP